MTDERIVAAGRKRVNAAGLVEVVNLVEDNLRPDGILLIEQSKEISPRTPTSRRPFGHLKKLSDKPVGVKIVSTGVVSQREPTLDETNEIVEQWSDYSPL